MSKFHRNWIKRRLRKTLHKQADKPTDTTNGRAITSDTTLGSLPQTWHLARSSFHCSKCQAINEWYADVAECSQFT